MLMTILTIACLLGLVVWIQLTMKKNENIRYRIMEDFWSKENRANQVRKKQIPKECFTEINLEDFPLRSLNGENSYEKKLLQLQKQVVTCSQQKMINMKQSMSNQEIKMEFGTANLELVAQYEENFHDFITLLVQWAEALFDGNDLYDAKLILKWIMQNKPEYTQAILQYGKIVSLEGNYTELKEIEQLIIDNDLQHEQRICEEIRILWEKNNGNIRNGGM